MLIVKSTADLKAQLIKLKGFKTVGFVPTMGALHQGHISLLQKSKQTCEINVCSIFINPAQFNNKEDYKKYPVTLEKDIYLLEKSECDVLFIPDVAEIYPDRIEVNPHFDLGYLETTLEGKYRPGHFQGVCRVVKRLLQIVTPTHLFIGQKDYQQCMVLKRLLQLMNADIELMICPTLREENGLAMSSRNLRLNGEQKQQAGEIYKTLLYIKQNIKNISAGQLKNNAYEYLTSKKFKVDYVEIADADNLKATENIDNNTKLIALIAAFINDIRLIDNMLLTD